MENGDCRGNIRSWCGLHLRVPPTFKHFMGRARGLVPSIRLHFIYVYANHVHIQGSLTEAWPRRGIKPGLSPVLRCQLAAAVIEKRHEGTVSRTENVCSLGQLLRWPILSLLVADIYFHKS